MQVVDHTINAAYSYRQAPQETMKELVSGQNAAKAVSWEPGKFTTFEFAELEASAISHWIDGYFVQVMACPVGEYHVRVSFEQL